MASKQRTAWARLKAWGEARSPKAVSCYLDDSGTTSVYFAQACVGARWCAATDITKNKAATAVIAALKAMGAWEEPVQCQSRRPLTA